MRESEAPSTSVGGAEPGERREPDSVLIQVPADPDYLPILRAASANLGAKLGCTLSEIADLRLAVDEACGLLLRKGIRPPGGTGADHIVARFTVDAAGLRIALATEAAGFTSPDTDEFGWTILTALVDELSWRVDGSTVHVEILKRQAAGR
ncbi:MAG: ATP-binding protein [Catenulispora sp.]